MGSRLAKKTDNKSRSSTFVAANVVTLATIAANTEVISGWGTTLSASPLRCDPLASRCHDCSHCFDSSEGPAPWRESQIEPSPHEQAKGEDELRLHASCVR